MSAVEPAPSEVEDETRCCYLCKRDLPLASFRVITTRQKRGGKVYIYRGPSSDCRDCNRWYKREQRRRKAERTGKPYSNRAAAARARDEAKAARRIARAICLAFRALVRLSPEEHRRNAIADSVRRQRVRYNTEPAFQAQRKALKIRRKRARAGVPVEAVDREFVAERDGWRCGLCGGRVTRENWSLDHVLPLSLGGEHTYENVQLAHLSCNSRKGNRAVPNAPRAPS